MTPTLRRRHQQIWMFLAILLPVGFMASWMAIPADLPTHELTRTMIPALTDAQLIGQGKGEGIQIAVFQAGGKEKQIVLKVLEERRSAGNWAYVIPTKESSGLNQASLLGLVEHTGNYRFNVPAEQELAGIRLYDGIKKKVLQTILIE